MLNFISLNVKIFILFFKNILLFVTVDHQTKLPNLLMRKKLKPTRVKLFCFLTHGSVKFVSFHLKKITYTRKIEKKKRLN